MAVVANVDRHECAVLPLRDDALDVALGKLAVRLVPVGADIRDMIQESRIGRGLWRKFLLAALGALIVEALLARMFVRRMAQSTGQLGSR